MRAITLSDTKVLIPNKEHKNFTEGSEVIEEGTQIQGEKKDIKGLRRGEPFTYKLFYTNKNQLIHLNKIKPMDVTEVTLGADAQQKPTIINETKVENANKNKVIFGVIGAVVGFAYCKYKKHDNTKTGTYTIAGAAVGVGLAYLYDMGRNKITIKAPKK